MESDEHTRERASVGPPDPLIGRVLDGRYRIEQQVARGGMAGVYRALDLRLERTVAVKVMHSGLGNDDEFAARFVREARAAAQLSHPNVVAVHDQGQDAGTVFLVMEYVPGQTLRDVIREHAPMTPARALALIEPVLSALAAAHRAGLVHRDIKPENVLVGEGRDSDPSRVKVADFGLAKAVSATSQHTATGVLIGTVSYLAPELVVQGRADARVDVYAVGVVLYELLTGVKPHAGETQIQVAYKHVHEDVPAPSVLIPQIPAYVDALVARATARDRDQRPADASVLLHQVRRVAQTLRDGIIEDPELEADLRPSPLVIPLPLEAEADREGLLDFENSATAAPEGDPAVVFGAGFDTAPSDRTQQIAVPDDLTTSAATLSPESPSDRTAVQLLSRPESDLADVATSRRRSRRGPLVLFLALLLVLAVGVGAWWFGFARYTTTPAVLDMNRAEAIAALDEAGLEGVAGDPSYDENIAKGRVVSTDPDAGDRVLPGESVVFSLSLGPERYDVPALAGQSADEARAALEETKLLFGRPVEKWNETVPLGSVVSTNPKAGTTVRPGTTVNVVISKGRKPIELTDYTGKKASNAQSALTRAGLEVKTEENYNDDVPEGIVISQSPSAGTLFKGDTVTLVVSQGPELVQMPRVIAKGSESARKELEALGFKVAIENSGQYLGLGFVLSSNPSAGTMIPKGSTVTLFLI